MAIGGRGSSGGRIRRYSAHYIIAYLLHVLRIERYLQAGRPTTGRIGGVSDRPTGIYAKPRRRRDLFPWSSAIGDPRFVTITPTPMAARMGAPEFSHLPSVAVSDAGFAMTRAMAHPPPRAGGGVSMGAPKSCPYIRQMRAKGARHGYIERPDQANPGNLPRTVGATNYISGPIGRTVPVVRMIQLHSVRRGLIARRSPGFFSRNRGAGAVGGSGRCPMRGVQIRRGGCPTLIYRHFRGGAPDSKRRSPLKSRRGIPACRPRS